MTTIIEEFTKAEKVINMIRDNADAMVQAPQAAYDIPEMISRITEIDTFGDDAQAAELKNLNKRLYTIVEQTKSEAQQDSTIDLSEDVCGPEKKATYEQVKDCLVDTVLLRRGPEASSADLKRVVDEVSLFIDNFNDASLKDSQSQLSRILRYAARL